MSNQGTGTLWVPGFAGILGVREDGGTLVLGSTTLLTSSLSNVAGEFDQFVPASGKVLTLSNTLTLAGTDGTTMTFPGTSATIARTDAANTFTGVQTYAGGIAFGAGATLDADSGTVTLVSNAGTLSKMAGVITTESLTTAGSASQALTITNTVCAAADILLVTQTGGSNTTQNISFKAVPGAGSFVITVYNNTAATALNGTLIFSFLIVKA